MATTTINPFVSKYIASIPYNPNAIKIPAQYNPYTQVVMNRPLQETIQSAVKYFYNPAEQRAYREATIPARINQYKGISDNTVALNEKGLLNSSVANRLPSIANMISQMGINRETDTTRMQYAQARNQEETKRLLDEINTLKLLQQVLINQRVYPNEVNYLSQ